MTEEKQEPFNETNVLLHLMTWEKNRTPLSKIVENLNGIAYEFYKDRIVDKGVIVPYSKSTIRQELLHLEVGESIYTEDEHYRNRTKSQANRIRLDTGKKFSTLKNGNGWRTWRVS